MLMTKAYITAKPIEGDNIWTVRIPVMEDNTETEAEFEAIASMAPGVFGGLEVGDCVIVDFEDDKYNTAIILGKLFVEIPNNTTAIGLFNNLEVTGSVKLPENTKIGNYSPQDIFNLFQGVNLKEGNGGSINPDDLKGYVQWTSTDRTVVDSDTSEDDKVEIYADHIRIMTGEEYDDYKKSEDFDQDLFNHTLYFLSSLPETDDTD